MIEIQNLITPALIILAVIFAGFSFYAYRHTNPAIPGYIKKILAVLRGAAFLLILLALFNSGFSLISSGSDETFRYIFIDNSSSIAIKDSSVRKQKAEELITRLSKDNRNRLFLFGSKIEPFTEKSFTLTHRHTNFSDIENFLSGEISNASSAVIISDGIITDGANPLLGFEKSGIPIFTIGIGDTSRYKDIEIAEPKYNTPLYRGAEDLIDIQILNTNLAGKNITVRLLEEGKPASQTNLVLNGNGTDIVRLPYKPTTAGEKRLTAIVSPLTEETNKDNNSRNFTAVILKDRIKVFMVAGAPSADFSHTADLMRRGERIRFTSVAEINVEKEVKAGSGFPIDSADIFFLIDYPSSYSNLDRLARIKNEIINRRKPVFYFYSGTDSGVRLNDILPALPFMAGKTESGIAAGTAYTSGTMHPLLEGIDSPLWELLSPVTMPAVEIIPVKGSSILLNARANDESRENPLLIVYEKDGRKSASFTGSDFWRWKLQKSSRLEGIAEKLFENAVEWLSAPAEGKHFSLLTSKKVFYNGEKVEISARVDDALYNPVENADVRLDVKTGNSKFSIPILHQGAGLYKGLIETAETGNLSIKGSASTGGEIYYDSLRLYVNETEVERLNRRMDLNFLKRTAENSGGSYFGIENYSGLEEKLNKIEPRHPLKRKKSFEILFAENEIILIILIILFVLEWTTRKYYRLL